MFLIIIGLVAIIIGLAIPFHNKWIKSNGKNYDTIIVDKKMHWVRFAGENSYRLCPEVEFITEKGQKKKINC